jgi:hypothetical protein
VAVNASGALGVILALFRATYKAVDRLQATIRPTRLFRTDYMAVNDDDLGIRK